MIGSSWTTYWRKCKRT